MFGKKSKALPPGPLLPSQDEIQADLLSTGDEDRILTYLSSSKNKSNTYQELKCFFESNHNFSDVVEDMKKTRETLSIKHENIAVAVNELNAKHR